MYKNDAEISAELEELTNLRGRLRDSYFGDSNNDALEAQISTLLGQISSDDIDDLEESGEMSTYEADAARDAITWLEGDSDEESLADEWLPLAK